MSRQDVFRLLPASLSTVTYRGLIIVGLQSRIPSFTNTHAHRRVQWTRNHKHPSPKIWQKGIRSAAELSFVKWRACACSPRHDPLSARLLQRGDHVCLLCCGGTLCRHHLGSIVPLKGRVTANQYKAERFIFR